MVVLSGILWWVVPEIVICRWGCLILIGLHMIFKQEKFYFFLYNSNCFCLFEGIVLLINWLGICL